MQGPVDRHLQEGQAGLEHDPDELCDMLKQWGVSAVVCLGHKRWAPRPPSTACARWCRKPGWLKAGWLKPGWIKPGWLKAGWLQAGWLKPV